MVNRDCEICYWDGVPKSLIVPRNNYLRNKEFYEAIKMTLINLFLSTDNSLLVAYYHGLNKSIIYKRTDVLNGIFDTKELRKRGIQQNG